MRIDVLLDFEGLLALESQFRGERLLLVEVFCPGPGAKISHYSIERRWDCLATQF